MLALQYVLLPVLAQTLGLSYTQIGALRAASSIAMSCLEIPSGFLATRFGERNLLVMGLFIVGLGYIGVASSNEFFGLCVFFIFMGCGAAFQHSLSSALLVKRFEGGLRRKALGTYNAFGDLGKLFYAAAFSLLAGMGLAWNVVLLLLALTAIVFGFFVWYLLRDDIADHRCVDSNPPATPVQSGWGHWGITDRPRFTALGVVVFLDGIVQSVFLTFIGFLLIEKGASAGHAAGGVVLTLIGGTAGKFAGGLLSAKTGDRKSFFIIQILTIAGLLAVLFMPLHIVYIVLPLAGIVVQGSSTVCYGSVGDYVEEQKTSRAYGIIYTLSSAATVAGPGLMGVMADRISLEAVMWVLIVVTIATLGFALSFNDNKKSIAV